MPGHHVEGGEVLLRLKQLPIKLVHHHEAWLLAAVHTGGHPTGSSSGGAASPAEMRSTEG